MVERFLFDGVDTETSTSAVGGQYQLVVDVLSNEAKPTIARFEHAFAWTEDALDAIGIRIVAPPRSMANTIWGNGVV